VADIDWVAAAQFLGPCIACESLTYGVASDGWLTPVTGSVLLPVVALRKPQTAELSLVLLGGAVNFVSLIVVNGVTKCATLPAAHSASSASVLSVGQV